MKAVLERIRGGAALRTDTVEGSACAPEVGKPFRMVAPALHPVPGVVDTRLVETSPVSSIVEMWLNGGKRQAWSFTTRSGSEYRLTEKDETGDAE